DGDVDVAGTERAKHGLRLVGAARDHDPGANLPGFRQADANGPFGDVEVDDASLEIEVGDTDVAHRAGLANRFQRVGVEITGAKQAGDLGVGHAETVQDDVRLAAEGDHLGNLSIR